MGKSGIELTVGYQDKTSTPRATVSLVLHTGPSSKHATRLKSAGGQIKQLSKTTTAAGLPFPQSQERGERVGADVGRHRPSVCVQRTARAFQASNSMLEVQSRRAQLRQQMHHFILMNTNLPCAHQPPANGQDANNSYKVRANQDGDFRLELRLIHLYRPPR
jgi:hypothetical protein